MVRSVLLTVAAIILSAAFFIFTDVYLERELGRFGAAVESLYDKTEAETANREDAYAVKALWQSEKSKLQIFVPHNDIAQVDYWLNEACAFIYTGSYALALANLEVVSEIVKNLPENYSLKAGNVL